MDDHLKVFILDLIDEMQYDERSRSEIVDAVSKAVMLIELDKPLNRKALVKKVRQRFQVARLSEDTKEAPSQVDMTWPDRSNFAMPYTDFMVAVYLKFLSMNIKFEDIDHTCPADADQNKTALAKKTSYRESMLRAYISPTTPYHGLLINHEVGTGKTRLALGLLRSFNETYNIRGREGNDECLMIWITTIAAKKSVQKQTSDFPAFYGSDKHSNPFSANAKSSRRHKYRKIAIFTFQEWRNILNFVYDYHHSAPRPKKGTSDANDKFGFFLRERARQYHGDPFGNTIVVVDEAHKIFETNNGFDADQEDFYYKRMAVESYRIAKQYPKQVPCKWLLLSATPVPTFNIPRNDTETPETAGGPLAPFKLLNLLIDDEKDWLPTKEEDFSTIKDGKYFANKARGLISYFNPVDTWKKVFAPLTPGAAPIQLQAGTEAKIKAKLDQTCKPKKDAATKRLSLGKCYRRRLHWLGNGAVPPCEGSGKTPASGKKCPKGVRKSTFTTKDGEIDESIVPRANALTDKITDVDAKDMREVGHNFKHIIYSSFAYRVADIYATALEMEDFIVMEPLDRLDELKIEFRKPGSEKWSRNYKKLAEIESPEFRWSSETPGENSEVFRKNVVFFMENNMSVGEVGIMQKVFNLHDMNNYGQIARVVILGSNRKEAISLFDVKYVHIMEPQATQTDVTQIVGRARRRCGHTGLPIDQRQVIFFTYKLILTKGILKLVAKESSDPEKLQPSFGEIAYAAVQVDPEIAAQLAISETILQWMKWSALDSIFINNPITSDEDIVPNSVFVTEAIENEENGTNFMLKSTMKGREIAELTSFKVVKECVPKTPKYCSVQQLRAICKVNGLDAKGKKSELLERCAIQEAMVQKWLDNPDAIPEKATAKFVGPKETTKCTIDTPNKCTVAELKEICKAGKNKVSGKKNDLIERCVNDEAFNKWLVTKAATERESLRPPIQSPIRSAAPQISM